MRTPRRAEAVRARRPRYQADLAAGTARFFEPRRDTCPWCGSARLRQRLRTTDLLQHKPGEFVLDQCGDCAHIFQNPRLNPDGLEFYYRDFYDGLGEQFTDRVSTLNPTYRSRAKMVAAHAEPKNWLDVGTSHGHFPRAARKVLPHTIFDGLDMSAGVELAQQRGRIDQGYRGHFTELASDLAERYDVVSMFHYLEHTPDPDRQLEAARQALRPGGYLQIEVPDPECRYGQLLGRWWIPWFQPQHLNFVPLGNLKRRLGELGFTMVAEQRNGADVLVQPLGAALLALSEMAPRGDQPWFDAVPGRSRRLLRAGMLAAGVSVVLLGGMLDCGLRPVARQAGLTHAYRVLARKDAL